MKKVTVQVKNDHLETLSRTRKPIIAITELIWNGLDADAKEVRVKFDKNKMGGIEKVWVTDNGQGLDHSDAVPAFENLGGSWKRTDGKTKVERRILHGRLGKGRFRAFSLGQIVEWTTRFSKNGIVLGYKVRGDSQDLGTFEIDAPAKSELKKTGTQVQIRGINKNFPSILGPDATAEITRHFALYLMEYRDVKIIYDGATIDPSAAKERVSDYVLPTLKAEDGTPIESKLTVIEWKMATERTLALCDENGFALLEIPPGLHAPGFNFTAYLKSAFLRELDDQNALVLKDLHPDLKNILDATRKILREHFRKRAAESAANVVEGWKKEKIYPYEGKAKDILEVTERQVFDVCALSLNTYLPDFESADRKSKILALRLLKHAVGSSPSSVRTILIEVLDLPEEKQEEFAKLLQKTSLGAILSASRIVTDRLDFLKGLEIMVFDKLSKEQILERCQLHRIIAEHAWIFGEEYNLTVDDNSLTEVLDKHLHLLRGNVEIDGPVLRENGSKGIIDLMFSRCLQLPRGNEREHLVVELKRPSVKIDTKALNQIRDYAFAIAEDERFKDTQTRWEFWALSNEMTSNARRQASQADKPEGLLYDAPDMKLHIWIKTWGQLIEECRGRLKFFQERLEYLADRDSALAYLRQTHAKYLPKALAE